MFPLTRLIRAVYSCDVNSTDTELWALDENLFICVMLYLTQRCTACATALDKLNNTDSDGQSQLILFLLAKKKVLHVHVVYMTA